MTRARLVWAALEDIEAAHAWYEGQRPGFGDEFAAAVDAAIGAVLAFPDAYPVVHRDARRFLVERFPYCLFYRIEDDGIAVVACMHAARDPERRRLRLGG